MGDRDVDLGEGHARVKGVAANPTDDGGGFGVSEPIEEVAEDRQRASMREKLPES